MRIRYLAVLPLLAVVAGCGAQAAATKSTPTSGLTPQTVPTPAPTPTMPTISGGQVAAVVNGKNVPMATYRLLLDFGVHQYAGQKVTTKQIAQQAMQQVIVNELVRQYAVAHHISVSNGEVVKQIQAQERQAGGVVRFTTLLKNAGLTMASYQKLMAPNLLAQKVSKQMFPASATQPDAHVRHILIATRPQGKPARTDAQAKALADKVLTQLKHGGNFAALAKKYSDDPGSAVKGGDLGQVFPGQTVPPFDHAAFNLPLHQPTIVHSVYGYHIVEVLSRGRAKEPLQTQQQQQQTKFSQWMQKQLKAAQVKKLAKVS